MSATTKRCNRITLSLQAKDLQLALILVCVVCMFFVTNLPRLLLNLYELFNVDQVISCGDAFLPPVWHMCMTSVNHLLLVLNTIANFVVYCVFNEGFKKVIVRLLGGKVALNSSRTPSQQGQTAAVGAGAAGEHSFIHSCSYLFGE